MEKEIIRYVENIRKKGDYEYILSKYVSLDSWNGIIGREFPIFENLTDFNYSSCFTFHLDLGEYKFRVGSEKFKNYLLRGGIIYRIQIQISAIAPYGTYKFLKYLFHDNVIKLEERVEPFLEEHFSYKKRIKDLLNNDNIILLDKEILNIEMDNVSLDMREDNVTIYHCLFEDEY